MIAMRWLVVLVAIATLSGACSEDSKPQPTQAPTHAETISATPDPRGAISVDNALHTANRDRLAICVSGMGGAKDAEAEAKALDNALVEVAKRPVWDLTGIPREPSPLVEAGCPFPPAHYGKHIDQFESGRWVDAASYYRLFVYVLPQDEVDNLDGFVIGREGAEEILRMSMDSGAEVTTGLYLGDEELDDNAFLVTQLAMSLGFE